MNKPKVLYVEDEIFLAKIVSETLERQGFDVVYSDFRKANPMFVCWISCCQTKMVLI
jgi:BarA-like signal transduction histidine kinase